MRILGELQLPRSEGLVALVPAAVPTLVAAGLAVRRPREVWKLYPWVTYLL